MSQWTVTWNFSKETYKPGEVAAASLWLANTGGTQLHLSSLELQFDFDSYDLVTVAGMIAPGRQEFLGVVQLRLPDDVVGRKAFFLEYDIHELRDGGWAHLGRYSIDQPLHINIFPAPFYRAFVSRGISTEDRVVGDPIAEMVREWGFDTTTVGIEVEVPDGDVVEAVRNEIEHSQGVIAIATPRHLDAITWLWQTLEWLHGEVGIAFGITRPLLILKDRSVTLRGLPSYLVSEGGVPLIEFDSRSLEELRVDLSIVMPEFRQSVKSQGMRDLLGSILRLATVTLAGVGAAHVLSGFTGSVSETTEG